jgi:hypothetical protein
MDIDGIIQSFLQEHDGSNANGMRPVHQPESQTPGLYARSPWFPHEQQQQQQQQQHHHHPQVPMGPEYAVGNPAMMPMQQPMNQSHVESGLASGYQWHEDPLFGLNGSSMDNFAFMGW